MAYTPDKPVRAARPEPPRLPASQGRQKRCSSPPPAARGLRHLLGSSGHSWRNSSTPDTKAQHPAESIQANTNAQASRDLWVVRRTNSHAGQQQQQRQLQGACSLNRVTACNHSQGLGGCMLESLEGRMSSCQPTHTRARKAEGVYRCPWSLWWWRWLRPSLQRCITTRPVCGPCSHALTSAERR